MKWYKIIMGLFLLGELIVRIHLDNYEFFIMPSCIAGWLIGKGITEE